MLGENFLSVKLKLNKRFNKISRGSVPYSKSKKIGIIIRNDQTKYNKQIENLVNTLHDDGKLVEVLCYQSDIVNSKYSIPFFSFSKKDLKWNGDINNSHVQKLIETKFDYLISISDKMDVMLDYLLCKSQSELRIANAGVHNENQAEMLVDCPGKNDLGLVAEQIGVYLKKIT